MLTPFLLSDEPRRNVTISSSDVMAAGWQDRGMALVMALNLVNAPTSFEVTLDHCTYSGLTEVLFENREVEVVNGVIKDSIEADGTRLYQIPEGPFPPDRATPASDNLRGNPSFELWVNAASPPDMMVKRTGGSTCFLDARTAVHGRHSLRLTAPATGGVELGFNGVPIQPGSRYRASLWAKADRSGIDVGLVLPDTGQEGEPRFDLTTHWQEYALIVTAQGDTEHSIQPKLRSNGPGTVWLDLFQIVPVE